MRRHLVRTLIIAAAIGGTVQAVRPSRTNPPIDRTRTLEASAVHPAVPVVQRACVNCHSNETTWPWYSAVAPVSWLIAHHVDEGRAAVNFSEWSVYTTDRQRKILSEACEEVTKRTMPLRSYAFAHPEIRLTSSEIRSICDLARVYSGPAPPEIEIEPVALYR